VIEGLVSHLRLLSFYLDEKAVESYGQAATASKPADVLARLGSALRAMILLRGTAQTIYDRARAACVAPGCTLAWEGRWKTALAAFASAQQEVLAKYQMFLRRNPLGVEEEDLPLYFGDVQGTSSRFFASSDYLTNGLAAPAVTQAKNALEAARVSWVQGQNSVVQDKLNEMEQARRLEDIGRIYGQPIVDACGLEGVTANDVLKDEFANKMSAETCYIDPQCVAATTTTADAAVRADLLRRLDEQAVKLQVCKAAFTHSPTTVEGSISLKLCVGDPANIQAVFDKVDQIKLDPFQPGTGLTPADRMIVCGDQKSSVAYLWGVMVAALPWISIDRKGPDPLAQSRTACEAKYGYRPLPAPTTTPKCLRGQIGSAASRLFTAKQEVSVALAQMGTLEVQLSGKWGLCIKMIGNDAARREAQATVDSFREQWKTAKGLARDTELLTDAVQSAWMGGAAGAGIGTLILPGVGTAFGFGVGAFIGFAVGGTGSDARQVQKELDDQMRIAEAEYQKLVENQRANIEVAQCLYEAEVLKSAMAVQVATIRTQALAVETAVLDMGNLISTVRQRATEGRAVLERERERKWGGFSHHFWFDEKVAQFQREFAWSKRLTYLALRALEYELQQTLSLRSAVLKATHPDQLQAALTALTSEQATRQINGKRPEEKSIVLSLRDEVWKVADRSNARAGERAENPKQRFTGRLAEASGVIRDRAGHWLGQGIRFALDPVTKSPGRTALPTRCAERLWRVVALVEGDVKAGATVTGAEVQLFQLNTFASQKCDRKVDGTALQRATIQPSKNLFKPGATGQVLDETNTYAVASLNAKFNTPLADFSNMSYLQGSSAELAGRGLYGEYILLFPRALIEAGFTIDKVEDVILRFDYLSVDDTPTL
jgi:hypothetical protein